MAVATMGTVTIRGHDRGQSGHQGHRRGGCGHWRPSETISTKAEGAGSIVTKADRAQPDINGQHKVRKNSCGTEDEFGASHPRLLLCCGHHMETTGGETAVALGRDTERGAGSPRHSPALDQVLSSGVFSTGVYHVGRLGALTPWSTADLSKTLPLPDQLREVQEQLYHLRWSTKDVAERALPEGLKQAKLPGVTGRAVHEIINQALEKLEAIQVPMPDYALKSAGAAVIHSKTSPSFRTGKAKFFLYSLPVMDYMRSPELILEPDNHPGNCWPFPGSQGHVFIKLSMPVIPRAITMDHVSGTAFHGESISGAPKDFAVYGFKEEHEEQGTFLGQFTFLAALNPSQTFQLKNELPGVVNYIRLQVLSNWGHPDYTCLYRFRVHGDPPKDGGDTAVSPVNKFH
ncbi:SUN domain-containing protein 3-like [Columba livia]|uniref:SUN domain-containing protein 3-like n=1 Tax=Columba livia TaxID=8932 RepID=UPI0031BA88CE